MTVAALQSALTDHQALALTLYGEARSERVEGRVAVGCVVRNRVRLMKTTYRAVCFARWQFSCWEPAGGDANHTEVLRQGEALIRGDAVESGSLLDECLFLADGLMRGCLRDRIAGATHYVTRQLFETNPPKWAKGVTPVSHVGSHVFFRVAL